MDAASRDPQSGRPAVSVVIPVHDVEPYLRQCLDSVLNQSIGLDRLEVVAVDDGSTDGSAQLLDEYAARYPQLTVVHEPNSGGPGRPRNVGLDHATGTYLFFLDADDYLGEEALERLVAMADRNGSDVVLGKMVGVGGRLVPERAFRRTLDRAELADVYSTLAVMKLFRRSFVERVGVRFAEGLAGGEDGPFTAELYLAAGTISVVADYDCYYYRNRPDSVTKRVNTESLLDYLSRMSARCELVARHRPPGAERDRLMARHIADLLRPFNSRRWLPLPPEERRQAFEAGAVLVRRWHTDRIQATLPPSRALPAYCLQHGLLAEMEDIVRVSASRAALDPVVEGTRVFARYPHFRDASRIPDSAFELTGWIVPHRRIDRVEVDEGRLRLRGEAYLTYLGGATTLVLRRWPCGGEQRFAATPMATPDLRDRYVSYPQAGFVADVHLPTADRGRPLPPGPWSLHLEVGVPGYHRRVPLDVGQGAATVQHPTLPQAGPALYRGPEGSLRLLMDPGAGLKRAAWRTLARAEPRWHRSARRFSALYGRGRSSVRRSTSSLLRRAPQSFR